MTSSTREKIVQAASRLFYGQGIGRVSMDAIAEKAGVTKRTLYYHFKSKDEIVAAHLSERDQPNLALFKRWYDEAEGGPAEKTRAIFANLAHSARHPKWKGCGFLRTSAELAHMPGHPAIKAGAQHKKNVETWLRSTLEEAGLADGFIVSRQIMLLLDGSFAVVLLHRDPSYLEAAGAAAAALIEAGLGRGASGSGTAASTPTRTSEA